MSTANKYYSGTGKDNKSTFAMTCNRLSLFLKEKGSLKDIGINANFDAVKGKQNLYTPATETNETTIDFLSKIETPVNSSVTVTRLPQLVTADSFRNASDSPPESSTTPMTIFYKGQVIVFDNVSADKARDIILTASGYQNSHSPYEAFKMNGSDLPIARRSSLHKFLAKRKERASERAPYQLPNRLMVDSSLSLKHKFDLNL